MPEPTIPSENPAIARIANMAPPYGREYVSVMRNIGKTDDQIIADFRAHVFPDLSEQDFIAALIRRTEAAKLFNQGPK